MLMRTYIFIHSTAMHGVLAQEGFVVARAPMCIGLAWTMLCHLQYDLFPPYGLYHMTYGLWPEVHGLSQIKRYNCMVYHL